MPQKTNLNVNPYFDDFDANKNFYRVLFKPGFPVQARELTTLQSILQNQVESIGNHLFKDGSMVIPGSIVYDPGYYSIKINPEHLGVDVLLYISELVGKQVVGATSGVVATIQNYSIPPDENVSDITLYVKYASSGESFDSEILQDGENLKIFESISYGNTTINQNNTVATVVDFNSSSIGSVVSMTEGIFFIRGLFIRVPTSKVILDPYTNTTSYRVGLTIFEEVVNSNEDQSLSDNANGFSNYSAPGADRLKISAILSKKPIDDFDDKNFVELLKVENGAVKKLQNETEYSIIKDYFAKRTYEESGNYTLSEFKINVQNSLSDGISNNGIYLSSQTTSGGNVPSDSLACINVSPGIAYVYGYDISISGNTILDVEKPRETFSEPISFVPFEMGNLLRVNRVYGTPVINVSSSTNIINLYNKRRNSTTSGTGTKIGVARVYSYGLTDSAYIDASSEWDLHLYDVQIFTKIIVNNALTLTECPEASFIEGISSGASGYVVEDASGTEITLSQISGSFINGEQIKINGTSEINRSIKRITKYTSEDIKSVWQDTNSISGGQIPIDFVADTVLYEEIPSGFTSSDVISITSGGTVTCSGRNFTGIRSDAIIAYQNTGSSDFIFNRIVSVASDGLSLVVDDDIPTVSGICTSSLPVSTITTPFKILKPQLKNQEKASLYTPLTHPNISNVDLSNSSLSCLFQVKEQFTGGDGTLSISNLGLSGITSAYFTPFDQERYSIIYSNGSTENLTSDQVEINSSGSLITFSGLTPNESNVTVNVSLNKAFVRNKTKIYTRSEKIIVDKTNSGVSTSTNGLTFNRYYGWRIEDHEISLNVPDAVKIIAIYESLDSSLPVLDKLTFVSGLSLNTNSYIGEQIVGETSGAIAQVVNRTSNEIEFVYLNSNKFLAGESVVFSESKITTNIVSITNGYYLDITSSYTLDKGQRTQFYDYSRIVRTKSTSAPSHKLLVIFNWYDITSNDNGDVYTVNSYTSERYNRDIPILDYTYDRSKTIVRATDILDFRPRLAKFTDINSSPFYYDTRSFLNTPNLVISPGESSVIKYSYYLPRTDKLVLNKRGELSLIRGVSSLNPKEPLNNEEVMDIAIINFPAYLYDSQIENVPITFIDNKRYTMRDIGKIEDRVSNLETLTSLTLLEIDTKALQIQDSDGLNRFKTGFFVDDFQGVSLFNLQNSDTQCVVDPIEQIMQPMQYNWSLKPTLALNPDLNSESADYSSDLLLLDSNIRKTGDLLTLNYEETKWITQPFASRVENINPFNVISYLGTIALNPQSDTWIRNIPITQYQTTTTGNDGRSFDYVGSVVTTNQTDPFARSRNVEFMVGALRSLTQHYAFLNNSSSIDIIPKLVEIEMISGFFEVGEDIVDQSGNFKCRVAQPNHKNGRYNNPDNIYDINPYNLTQTLPSSYSGTSTVLNLDTKALSDESLGRYFGYISKDQFLYGRNTNAVAKITNIRLISDSVGQLIGCFWIRDPNIGNPILKIPTGESTFKFNSNAGNQDPIAGSTLSSQASGIYATAGVIATTVTTIVQVRNPPPPPPPAPSPSPPAPRPAPKPAAPKPPAPPPVPLPPPPNYGGKNGGKDPLAQSFTVDETGAFLTSVDLYFANKDPIQPVYVEIRTVELGTPTEQLIQDYASTVIFPNEINTSLDASVATNIKFPSPVYLQPNTEYALVLLSPTSDNNEIWIARTGEPTIETQNLPDAETVLVTSQYIGGSLFKSQNGSIWTASQYEDIKFTLYKAKFTSSSGELVCYNPDLNTSDSNLPPLIDNAITTYPRKLKVGITTSTGLTNILTIGKKVGAGGSTPYGYIENVGSEISSISITNAGIGYSNGTYDDVQLFSVTGKGSGATATIVVSSNEISSATISATGNGYVIGDALGITTSNVSKGSNGTLAVDSINGIDTLYLTNVQGEDFYPNTSTSLNYYNGLSWVGLANTYTTSATLISDLYSGNVMEINQFNHGMHSDTNVLRISGIFPDTVPTYLSSDLSLTDTTISVVDSSMFGVFEGITTSRGYILIDNEVIEYNAISTGSLNIKDRGIQNSQIQIHSIGTPIYKYEINGVSLHRINNIDITMSNNTYLKSLRDFDTYHIEIDRSPRSVGNMQLSFANQTSLGGSKVSVTQNIQYTSIIPQFNAITPGQNTSLTAQVRTVSSTSCGGNEESFLDNGYENVELNKINYFSTPRMVASRVNEIDKLSTLSQSKSFSVKLTLNSGDENLSPVVDTQNGFIIYNRNRINNPISNYSTDGRVNLVTGDPHTSIYISNKISLSQPATSLQVYFTSERPAECDFRVLYQIYKSGTDDVEPSFELFPGYDNLSSTNSGTFGNSIIDDTKNSGLSDVRVVESRSGEFREYQYTVDNLDQFNAFAIKIVMSSTNECKVPKFKELRAIALA